MSSLVVEVCRISAVDDHPNADRMKIATVKGWRTCIPYNPETGKAQFEVGNLCVYFPPDSVLKPALIQRMGIEKYVNSLAKLSDGTRPEGGRIKAARLRGYPSYGAIMPINPELGDDPNWQEGTNVADHFEVVKWEPPLETLDGDAERQHSKFHTYTDIENFGNFPNVFAEGEEVIFDEKIHGKNCRIGVVLDTDELGNPTWTFCAGSHGIRRKEIDSKGRRSDFWNAANENVQALLNHAKDMTWKEDIYSVILFGEIYGSGCQDLTYGFENGEKGFRAFDIAVNGIYLNYDDKKELFEKFGVKQVPILYRGPFNMKVLEEYTSGITTVTDGKEVRTKFKGREGIVIRPVIEDNSNPILNGRKILKSISPDYLDRKGGTDFH